MLKKLQIFGLLVIVLLCFFVTFSYSQSKKPNDNQVTSLSNKFTKPSLTSGQWVLYEINISQIASLNKPSRNNTYLLKTSIVGSEIINGESYFWEEVSLVSEGLVIKSLIVCPFDPAEAGELRATIGGSKSLRSNCQPKKLGSQKPKRIIFQRAGLPAVEIDRVEIGRQLNISLQAIIPEIIWQLPISNSHNANSSGAVSQPTKVTYTLPVSKEQIECRELSYNNPEKGGQIIIWWCEHIPLTGFTKLSYLSKDSIVSVKLVNFGFRETVSAISGKVLKFGEVYK